METAKEKLKRMIASDVEPSVSDAEVEELLAAASVPDGGGLAPIGVGWTPTYDLNAAAAAGWMIKAARAAALTEVDPPGSGIVTSKVFDNCRAMARIYSAKRAVSVSVQ
jgi:hypothetical protein